MDIFEILAKNDIDDKLKQEILSCFKEILNENIHLKATIISSRLYFNENQLKTIENKHIFVKCNSDKQYEEITNAIIKHRITPIKLLQVGLIFFN